MKRLNMTKWFLKRAISYQYSQEIHIIEIILHIPLSHYSGLVCCVHLPSDFDGFDWVHRAPVVLVLWYTATSTSHNPRHGRLADVQQMWVLTVLFQKLSSSQSPRQVQVDSYTLNNISQLCHNHGCIIVSKGGTAGIIYITLYIYHI